MMLLNSMIKKFVPAKVMHGSREGDGTHFSFSGPGDHIYFQPEALLLPGAACLGRVACKVGPAVDVTGEWRIEEQTWMRRISLVYPGGDDGGGEAGEAGVSALFPIGDLVLQCRDGIGRGHYGVSHIMVGIPVDTYLTIWNGINRQLQREVNGEWQDQPAVHQHGGGPTSFSVHEASPHDGHYWLDATLQRSLKGAVANPDGILSVDVTAEMLRTGASFKCDAAAGFRLIKKWDGEWSLRMTLWTVHLKDADRELDDRYPESFGKGRVSGYAPPRVGSVGRLGDPL